MLNGLATRNGGRLGLAALLAVCLAGLRLHLDHALRPPQHPVDDARAYARISRALFSGEGYTQGSGFEQLQSASNYQPGLPLLVARLAAARPLEVPSAFWSGCCGAGGGRPCPASGATSVYPRLRVSPGVLLAEPIG